MTNIGVESTQARAIPDNAFVPDEPEETAGGESSSWSVANPLEPADGVGDELLQLRLLLQHLVSDGHRRPCRGGGIGAAGHPSAFLAERPFGRFLTGRPPRRIVQGSRQSCPRYAAPVKSETSRAMEA